MNGAAQAVRRSRQQWPPPRRGDTQEVRLAARQKGLRKESFCYLGTLIGLLFCVLKRIK